MLQIVYGADVASIRDEILSYLKLKGIVLFLFDNLDRMRTPGGFDDSDGIIIGSYREPARNCQALPAHWP